MFHSRFVSTDYVFADLFDGGIRNNDLVVGYTRKNATIAISATDAQRGTFIFSQTAFVGTFVCTKAYIGLS